MVLRLAFALGYWVDKPLTHDEHEYLMLGGNIAAGRGFAHLNPDGSPVPGEHFGRAPLYPLFLAGVIRLTGFRRGPDSVATPPAGTDAGRRRQRGRRLRCCERSASSSRAWAAWSSG